MTARVALALALLFTGTAGAEPGIIAVVGRTIEDATLVSADGGVFARAGDGAWRRANLGGVSAALVGARRGPRDLYALGTDAPPYRFNGRTWTAQPLGRPGALVMSLGAAAAFAVGRRVFVLAKEGPKALPPTGLSSEARIVGIWAAGPGDVVIASRVELRRFGGGAWRRAVPAFARPEEQIAQLLPGAGAVFAVGDAGSVVRVDKGATRRLQTAAALGSFTPRLSAVAGGKTFLLGSAAQGSETHWVVARIDGTTIVAVDRLPPEATHEEPVGLLATERGDFLVATRGAVFARVAGRWSGREVVDTTPRPTPPHLPNPPATVP